MLDQISLYEIIYIQALYILQYSLYSQANQTTPN